MTDEMFIKKYEELLDKGYCDCNEMNCLDNNVPRKILNIVKGTKLEAKQLLIENQKRKEIINKIKKICESVPPTWSICGVDVIHEIEKVLEREDI